MVGPKPKPVRPLNAAKPGLEKPSEIKTVGKKKSKKAESTRPAGKEPEVGKEISKVPVKPSESEPKNANTTDAPLSQETKAESVVEKMPESAYPEPGKVWHAGH